MKKRKKKSRPQFLWLRRIQRAFKLFLFASLLSCGYLYLPRPARSRVIEISPHLDLAAAALGFPVSVFIDSLPVWGDEVRIPCSDREWETLCKSTPKAKGAQRLDNPGFTVGYSETLRNPLWVQYRLFDVPSFKRGKRPSRFRTDSRTTAHISHDDYTGSGFDRGHMAPNFGIATRYGREGQLATFQMSNIIPQTPTVNRNVWKEIEMLNAKQYGRCLDAVLIITGPVFGKNPARLQHGVCVPEAYYKIVLDRTGGELRALAFVLRADSPATRRLNTALVSIDQIEAWTGIDMLHSFSSRDQKKLESRPANHLWFILPDQFTYCSKKLSSLRLR